MLKKHWMIGVGRITRLKFGLMLSSMGRRQPQFKQLRTWGMGKSKLQHFFLDVMTGWPNIWPTKEWQRSLQNLASVFTQLVQCSTFIPLLAIVGLTWGKEGSKMSPKSYFFAFFDFLSPWIGPENNPKNQNFPLTWSHVSNISMSNLVIIQHTLPTNYQKSLTKNKFSQFFSEKVIFVTPSNDATSFALLKRENIFPRNQQKSCYLVQFQRGVLDLQLPKSICFSAIKKAPF